MLKFIELLYIIYFCQDELRTVGISDKYALLSALQNMLSYSTKFYPDTQKGSNIKDLEQAFEFVKQYSIHRDY